MVKCSGEDVLNILHQIPPETTALNLTGIRHSDADAFFHSFAHLASLRHLVFTDCHLGSIRSGLFEGLGNLLELSIVDCDLGGFVPKEAFRSMKSLQVLVIDGTAVAHLHEEAFLGLLRLTSMTLTSTLLQSLPAGFVAHMPALKVLDLSQNPFVTFNRSQFSSATSLLEKLVLTGLPHLVAVHGEAFSPLPNLRVLHLSDNPLLEHINPMAFGDRATTLQEINLSNNALSTIYWTCQTPYLTHLDLHGNNWHCDCGISWLRDIRVALANVTPTPECSHPNDLRGKPLLEAADGAANCTAASALTRKEPVDVRPGSSALLECQVTGNPRPNMRWITPQLMVLHWYPDVEEDVGDDGDHSPLPKVPIERYHPASHDRMGNPLAEEQHSHVQVLRNGNLFVTKANSADAGPYWCVADNSLGSANSSVALRLDYDILSQVKVVSVLVGLASAVAFMLAMLLVQLLNTVLDRWGWECCCCTRCGALPPKARRFKAVFEGVEQYKTQQLDRLRDNYQQQMQKVKDNGAQQMEWLRDSYSSQVEKLRDLRDYGTHQLDRIRDQYYDQVRRVRDYTASQMNRVRENYIFQRNRIRKFSAHQLVRLRENYKLQQMHLNKILENLNIESCRTVAGQRSESVVFTASSGTDLASVRLNFPRLAREDGCSSLDDEDDHFPSLMALSARALEEAGPFRYHEDFPLDAEPPPEVIVASSSTRSIPQEFSGAQAV